MGIVKYNNKFLIYMDNLLELYFPETPVAFYPFDNSFLDSSGVFNLSPVMGVRTGSSILYETGKIGYAVKMPYFYPEGCVDGECPITPQLTAPAADSSCCCLNNDDLRGVFNNRNPWSVSMWFKYNGEVIHGSGFSYLFATNGGPTGIPNKGMFAISINDAPNPGFSFSRRKWVSTPSGGWGQVDSSSFSIDASKYYEGWHHLVSTYDGSISENYIDNELKGRFYSNIDISLGIDGTWIGGGEMQGNRTQVTNIFNGSLDQTRIYDDKISDKEREYLWNNGFGR